MGLAASISALITSTINNRNRRTKANQVKPSVETNRNAIVGAINNVQTQDYQSFDNASSINFDGSLKGFHYFDILRDKQRHIIDIYKLADYYTDSDPLIHGIVKHVYVPYSVCSPWVLSGASQKVIKVYENEYKRIRLRQKMQNIFLEYWKYGNTFAYWLDGNLITLPPHKCKVGNVSKNGIPIVDFDCQSVYAEWRAKGYNVKQNWIKDNNLQTYFKGFPPEVRQVLNDGRQYAQLNPKNVFPLQGAKESWQRYAIPFIVACLSPLAKKELISHYENALLNLGIRSFVHVTYGDSTKGQDILPDVAELTAVHKVFSKAMSGFPLAVTNHMAKATVLQPDTSDLFQWDNYKNVNSDILSAGGISGILVTGNSQNGSTFASAQVSMQTAAARIDAARDEFCQLMNKINERIYEDLAAKGKYNIKSIPKFNFLPLDLSGKKSLRETCVDLWQKGLVSTKTMMQSNGYSLQKQKEQRKKESQDDTDVTMIPRSLMETICIDKINSQPKEEQNNEQNNEENKVGRPEMDETERNSDPSNSQTGKQPKPSNPQGSMDDE